MDAAVIGDIVTIKPEWLAPHETPGKLYRVMYANYETKRVYIEPLESTMVLKPQSPASFEMLDLVESSPAVPHRKRRDTQCAPESN